MEKTLCTTMSLWIILTLNTALVQTEMEGFIVGGVNSDISRNPHAAFLTITCFAAPYGFKSVFSCGSSIVNQRLLLTAAHCLQSCYQSAQILIRIGNNNKRQGYVVYASGYVLHQNYNPMTIANDIAMIKIDQDLPLGAAVKRVVIMREPPYYEAARVAGWGMIDERTSTYGDYLKELEQTIVERNECVSKFGFGSMPDGTLCGVKNRYEFASSGDSGSALIVRDFIQVGLVSYKSTIISPYVAIYTDVGYHYDWITQSARTLFCMESGQ